MERWAPCDADGGLTSLVRLIVSRHIHLVEIISSFSVDLSASRCGSVLHEPPLLRRKLSNDPHPAKSSSMYILRLHTSDAETLQYRIQMADIVGFCFRVQRTVSCCALFHSLPRQFVADTDEGGRMEWTLHLDGVFASTTITTRDNVAVILNANFPQFVNPTTNAEASCLALLCMEDSVLDEAGAEREICQAGQFLDFQLFLPISRRNKSKTQGDVQELIVSNSALLRNLGVVFGPLALSPDHIRNVVIVINMLSPSLSSKRTTASPPPPPPLIARDWFEKCFRGVIDRCNAALAQSVCDNMDTFSRATRSKPCDAQRAVLCRSIAESITSIVLRSKNQSFVDSVCVAVGIAAPNASQLLAALEDRFMDSPLK